MTSSRRARRRSGAGALIGLAGAGLSGVVYLPLSPRHLPRPPPRRDRQPNGRDALRSNRVRDGRRWTAGARRPRRRRRLRPGRVSRGAACAERVPRHRPVPVRLPAHPASGRRVGGRPGGCARRSPRRARHPARGGARSLGGRALRDAVRDTAPGADCGARPARSRGLSVSHPADAGGRGSPADLAGDRVPVRHGAPVGFSLLAGDADRAARHLAGDSRDAARGPRARER